ncbi:Peptidase A1 [Cocos nucifera]|uniref:Peptidase A1 n=1 Tax=Cocos nucifera TaxID=13894 RepID=A0A8K0N7T7_COCNU|nr:Peptidase A1 [Cocos nucifera]
MASSSPSLRPLLLFAAVALAVSGNAGGATLGLDFHHRFSDRVRRWAEAHGGLPGGWWPEKGSVEYYATLARHDRALADGGHPDKDLAFVDGNKTVSLGFLHYAFVALGTPNLTFLVALDTGSDLFWVPFEDILYFKTEETIPKVVKAPIVFGCGRFQTGVFLDGTAPNGLFGLGLKKVSVPSVLASKGYTSDSFSMCFGSDGIGRIYFGDKGSSDQEETPFHVNHRHPTYNISFTGLEVGNISVDVKFSAIVDSGTSFTYLADPEYTKLAESVQENRHKSDPDIPFEYCYKLSPNQSSIMLPETNLTTKGGSRFPVNVPIIFVSYEQRTFACCLAIVKSHRLNIIGQNFMTGLRIVFDRERMILGYDAEDSSTPPVNRNQSAIPPSPAYGPSSYTPDATKGRGNSTQVTELAPSSSHSSHLNSMKSILWTLVVFSLAIL